MAHEQNRTAKIEYYSKLIKKIKDDLASRDLSKIPTEKLLPLMITCEKKLSELTLPQQIGGDSFFNLASDYPSFNFNPEE